MKTKITLILVAIITLTQQNADAQVWMGVYGMRTNSTNNLTSPDIGGGFAMSFLSDGISLAPADLKKFENKVLNKLAMPKVENEPCTPNKTKGLQLHLGGNFYYSGLGQRNFSNVPLLAPQIGLAKVNLQNAMWSMNAMARFSYSNPSIFTPYVDVFGGYRGMFSNVTVTPYNYTYQPPSNNQNANNNDKPIASMHGLSYGVGGGIMTSLTKKLRLDVGVSYSEAFQTGHLVDLNSVSADQSGINLNLKNGPNGMMMINVGVLFYLCSDDNGKDDCNCNHHHSSSNNVRWGGGSWGGGHGGGGNVGMHFGGGGIRIK